MSKTPAPRRRIEATIKIGADSWRDLQGALRCLETEVATDGRLSKWSVSGGFSFGWTVESSEDETITHDSWADANKAYCEALRETRDGVD